MPFHRTPEQWQERIDLALLGELDQKTIRDCEEAEMRMRERMRKHDAIVDLVCGR